MNRKIMNINTVTPDEPMFALFKPICGATHRKYLVKVQCWGIVSTTKDVHQSEGEPGVIPIYETKQRVVGFGIIRGLMENLEDSPILKVQKYVSRQEAKELIKDGNPEREDWFDSYADQKDLVPSSPYENLVPNEDGEDHGFIEKVSS